MTRTPRESLKAHSEHELFANLPTRFHYEIFFDAKDVEEALDKLTVFEKGLDLTYRDLEEVLFQNDDTFSTRFHYEAMFEFENASAGVGAVKQGLQNAKLTPLSHSLDEKIPAGMV